MTIDGLQFNIRRQGITSVNEAIFLYSGFGRGD